MIEVPPNMADGALQPCVYFRARIIPVESKETLEGSFFLLTDKGREDGLTNNTDCGSFCDWIDGNVCVG